MGRRGRRPPTMKKYYVFVGADSISARLFLSHCTPHPSAFGCHLLPLEKAWDRVDATFALQTCYVAQAKLNPPLQHIIYVRVGEGFSLPRVQDRHEVIFVQKTTHPSFAANIMFATNATFPDKGRLGYFALCGERARVVFLLTDNK